MIASLVLSLVLQAEKEPKLHAVYRATVKCSVRGANPNFKSLNRNDLFEVVKQISEDSIHVRLTYTSPKAEYVISADAKEWRYSMKDKNGARSEGHEPFPDGVQRTLCIEGPYDGILKMEAQSVFASFTEQVTEETKTIAGIKCRKKVRRWGIGDLVLELWEPVDASIRQKISSLQRDYTYGITAEHKTPEIEEHALVTSLTLIKAN